MMFQDDAGDRLVGQTASAADTQPRFVLLLVHPGQYDWLRDKGARFETKTTPVTPVTGWSAVAITHYSFARPSGAS